MRTLEDMTVHLPAVTGSSDLVDARLEPLNVLADGWEAFASVGAALDGYAYAVTEGIHVLLCRTSIGTE